MPLAVDPRPTFAMHRWPCDSKIRFVSERDARTWLKGLMRRRRTVADVARMTPYRCKVHNCWHLGHKPVGRKPHRPS